MKTYSGSTSEGFLPATLSSSNGATTAVAPAPDDPGATFTDFLDQHQGDAPPSSPASTPASPAALFTGAISSVLVESAATAQSVAPAGPAAASDPAKSGEQPAPSFPAPPSPLAELTPALPKSPTPLPTNQAQGALDPNPTESESTTTSSLALPFPAKTGLPAQSLDLSVMLARSALLAANARQTPAASATAPASTFSAATFGSRAHSPDSGVGRKTRGASYNGKKIRQPGSGTEFYSGGHFDRGSPWLDVDHAADASSNKRTSH